MPSRRINQISYASIFRHLVLLIACSHLVEAQVSPQRTVVTGKQVTASARVVIGGIPKAVQSGRAKLLTPLDTAQKMRLTLVLLPPNRAELDQRVKEILDPHSAQYRHFLTFDEWKARYAPSDADVAEVETWLKGAGLTEVHRFETNHALVVDGDVALVEKIFTVAENQYQVGAETFFANDRAPTIPASIAPKLADVLGLSSIEAPQPNNHLINPLPLVSSRALPHAAAGDFVRQSSVQVDGNPAGRDGHLRLPANLRQQIAGPLQSGLFEPTDLWSPQAYNFSNLARLSHCCNPNEVAGGSPKETSIAIIGGDSPQLSDITTFYQEYGIAGNLTLEQVDGPACCELEITLDSEWAGAMTNSFGTVNDAAHIYIYAYSRTTSGDELDGWEQALSENKARVASTSYGSAEDDYGGLFKTSISDYRDVTNAMVAQGWTIVAASDDRGGYANCSSDTDLAVQYPSSDPNVIAVGGTALTMNATASSPLNSTFGAEHTWFGNGCFAGGNNNGGGGGGGCSNTFFAPAWQTSVGGCPDNRRAIPDIALNASAETPIGGQTLSAGNFQVLYYLGSWSKGVAGGTSVAAPEMAGFFAQEDSYLVSINQAGNICGPNHNAACAPLGNPGPALYAASSGPHDPYYDVNDGLCTYGSPGKGYCSGPGYDKATGWGSANMLQLAWAINHYVNSPATAPSIVWSGPPSLNQWFSTDQLVSFTVTGATVGVAGYTAAWDHDPGDPATHSTPGTGDPFWDGPQITGQTTGSLHLIGAGPGCHLAYVRAWDNDGVVSTTGAYGPICYGNIGSCQMSTSCPVPIHEAPTYTISCPTTVDFYNSFSDGTRGYLATGLTHSDEMTDYAVSVLTCQPGTSDCNAFSIDAPESTWCSAPPNPPTPPPPPPKDCCKACIAAGGTCHRNPNGTCSVCQ